MMERLQNFFLEGAILITFFSKVPSCCCFLWAQLKKENHIWLWEASIRLFAPLQAEVLSQTKKIKSEVTKERNENKGEKGS